MVKERVKEINIRGLKRKIGIYEYDNGVKAIRFADDFLLLKPNKNFYFYIVSTSQLRRFGKNIEERAIPIFITEFLEAQNRWIDSGLLANLASEQLLIQWFCMTCLLQSRVSIYSLHAPLE